MDVIYDMYILFVSSKKFGDVKLGKGLFVIYVLVVYNKLFNFIIEMVEVKEILIQ